MSIVELLEERGFVEDITHDKELRELAEKESLTCYIGFDPTASSLHVGSLIPIMALAHMQQSGHRPIALVGGGTGLVGDPSGKTEMRQLITAEQIEQNLVGIKEQLSRFMDFVKDDEQGEKQGGALLLNNAQWLTSLEYIPFLRDIGKHFSVNRMIKAESYKTRLDSEEGLNFIEFNYMLLQAYDFLKLSEVYGCTLQMGGSDQWGNIVAGIDLIRRVSRKPSFGLTFPLITTSSGAKMGKTAKGAVWLDAQRTSPYEYYQYWINTHDDDVARFLALFTFLPMAEIGQAGDLSGADLNIVKTVLAFEATRIVHGPEAARQSYHAASVKFGGRSIPEDILPTSQVPRQQDMSAVSTCIVAPAGVIGIDVSGGEGYATTSEGGVPQTEILLSVIEAGLPVFDLFFLAGLAKSKGEARRLIKQGGGYLNDQRLATAEQMVTSGDIRDELIRLRAGKKRYHNILVVVEK